MINLFYELAEKAMELERKGKRMVRLNVGDTNLPVPACALDAARQNLAKAKSGYGPSAGLPALRQAIAAREGCGYENVVVGPGSKHLLFALVSILAGIGKKVALPLPCWPAYGLILRQTQSTALEIRATLGNNWEFGSLPPADAAIICNPLNPTSTIYKGGSLRAAVAEAEEKGTHVIIDEAYRGLSFEPIEKVGKIRLRSFSKEFCIENWRLGYAIAPVGIAKKLESFNQITCTCVPSFVQEAGIACLENEKEILAEHRKAWIARADAACKSLVAHGFKFARPQSGIYVFASHEEITDSGKYALTLLDKGVAVAPGSDFGGYGKFVRICINQPPAVLEEAIGKMADALPSQNKSKLKK
ncbi:MAG: pyridoxal phosphate-dependent aminotransferase [Candidatus Micrarchaeota archaeon]|nr:pyridoxal phosphate-dependent aminotransferase [Candidatus Micrarchaeota archaeon]